MARESRYENLDFRKDAIQYAISDNVPISPKAAKSAEKHRAGFRVRGADVCGNFEKIAALEQGVCEVFAPHAGFKEVVHRQADHDKIGAAALKKKVPEAVIPVVVRSAFDQKRAADIRRSEIRSQNVGLKALDQKRVSNDKDGSGTLTALLELHGGGKLRVDANLGQAVPIHDVYRAEFHRNRDKEKAREQRYRGAAQSSVRIGSR